MVRQFRPATAVDVDKAVELIIASGPEAFRYVFASESTNQVIDFLRYCFVREGSQFSYRHHYVLEQDGNVVGIGATWQHADNFRFTTSLLLCSGVGGAFLIRGALGFLRLANPWLCSPFSGW